MFLDTSSAISVALLVAFSYSGVIPILSEPFLTAAKKLFQPRAITGKIIMAMIIHVRIAITQSHYSLYLTYL